MSGASCFLTNQKPIFLAGLILPIIEVLNGVLGDENVNMVFVVSFCFCPCVLSPIGFTYFFALQSLVHLLFCFFAFLLFSARGPEGSDDRNVPEPP